ncbi:YopX family protein [Brevibacillus laterosporus]|uniref:YopX family protein n=1 Tax=Brevibacillus laterosporus TaxID=1465 RepID=UPI0018CFC757|nr:YopX family protein [Brevibacillus laterosporus]MBG9796909.1 hypothetical protein [Brevibacillus laterosporus]MCR8939933.1 YopX family protein [Brevibacillus laterosporus]MCZ0842573.1 YopX family protein [Brevibacillus laterosporus]MCZ0847130.1 YopX family protein [Brevibacillus laterosporus]MED1911302.1 YopX family protein [Brevibacillus laterosporus]
MREIKFRIWDKDYKKMRRCGENTHDSIYFDEDGTALYYNLQNGCGSLPDGTGTYDLMQYTGLKDKNGKEIYEGDIVKGKSYSLATPSRLIGKVQYNYNGFHVYGIRRYKGMFETLGTAFEVIGNIYENPHLLNQE